LFVFIVDILLRLYSHARRWFFILLGLVHRGIWASGKRVLLLFTMGPEQRWQGLQFGCVVNCCIRVCIPARIAYYFFVELYLGVWNSELSRTAKLETRTFYLYDTEDVFLLIDNLTINLRQDSIQRM